jgi:hypothetical protein
MRNDPVLKLTAGRAPDGEALASQPTLSRFENRVSAREVARLNRLLVQHYIRLHRKHPPAEIILDIDPTDDPCHGAQQMALFNGFYGQHMYLPLLVYERASGLLLGVRLRAGNAHAAHRVLQVLRPIVRALQDAFPRTRIIVRADAGLAVPRLYDYCEEQGLSYLIGIGANKVFRRHTDIDLEILSERFRASGRPRKRFSSLWHKAGSWPAKRRVIYKLEAGAQGTNRRFVVTNMKGFALHLYRRYADRGTAETFIDELKNEIRADRLSCHAFVANAFRLIQFALAYNLLRVFGGALRGTALEGASAETIRSRVLKIGARVRQTVRRVWVHMAGGFPFGEALRVALQRIQAMPHAPPVAA